MTRKPSESPPSPDSNIPPRILWLHNNLPWKQFFYVEALFIAAVTVLVAIGAAVIDNVSGGLTAPCTTKPCDDALRLTRQFERASLPTCDGFYEHLCGGGFSRELPRRFQVEHVVSDILRDRARKATVLSSAVNKLSVFFASCRFQLTVHGAFYGLGDQITDVLILLKAIGRIKFELLLVPFSPEELRRVDLLYRDLPVRSYDAYYENRLLPVSLLSDGFDLYQRHSRCLKNDVRGVVTPSRELVCVSPRALTEPLYFPGAEAIINLPTLGFLLARPYADVIYEALRTAPAGTEPSRRFTSMTDCLESQVQVLTNITLVRDPRPEALFRHAGALQLAYEVAHNSGGFRTGNEARRVFFERHCWLWCSGYLRGVKSLEGWPLSGKNVCNMAVRNVLAFYRAFRCYPEDYMGSAEICLVFGRAPQANE
ncbi:uncharacterized protein LOC144168078 [Haemaphysalis longicornis]